MKSPDCFTLQYWTFTNRNVKWELEHRIDATPLGMNDNRESIMGEGEGKGWEGLKLRKAKREFRRDFFLNVLLNWKFISHLLSLFLNFHFSALDEEKTERKIKTKNIKGREVNRRENGDWLTNLTMMGKKLKNWNNTTFLRFVQHFVQQNSQPRLNLRGFKKSAFLFFKFR